MRRDEKAIRYTDHARRRMAQRGITQQQVEAALARPDAVRPADTPDARQFEKRLSKRRRITIVAVETSDAFRVVTLW